MSSLCFPFSPFTSVVVPTMSSTFSLSISRASSFAFSMYCWRMSTIDAFVKPGPFETSHSISPARLWLFVCFSVTSRSSGQ